MEYAANMSMGRCCEWMSVRVEVLRGEERSD